MFCANVGLGSEGGFEVYKFRSRTESDQIALGNFALGRVTREVYMCSFMHYVDFVSLLVRARDETKNVAGLG